MVETTVGRTFGPEMHSERTYAFVEGILITDSDILYADPPRMLKRRSTTV